MKSLVLVAVCFVSTLVAAQMPEPPVAQQDAMKKCAFLAGQWKGEGYVLSGPGQRHTFVQTEKVTTKLDGLVLEIEGLGKDADGKTAHQALGLLSFDPRTKEYRFRSYDGHGRYIESAADCSNGTFKWTLAAGPRTMRFTIRQNDAGQWYEIGESSANQTDWQKVFEMTLTRVQ